MKNASLVFETIDLLAKEYLDIWVDVCNIESPSIDKSSVNKVGSYFCKIAQQHGWKVEIYPQERFGDVICITLNPNAKGEAIALSGHMDTVHPIGLFGNPAVRIEGDKIYGPGVMDCKGGIVAGFLAMHALEKCNYTKRPIMMLLQSNEEIGSGINNKQPIKCICERAKNAVAFLNLEGHEGYFSGKTCLIRKGIVGFNFRIYGVSAHSSYCAREGANAITEASYKIIELEKFKNDSGITINVGKIKGGTVRNTIPDYCEFEIDCRYLKQSEFGELVSITQKIANETHVSGCKCEIEMISNRVPMELCDRNLKLLDQANKAFLENGLSTLAVGTRNGGSDASDVTAYGIACLDSLGVAGERAHSKEEYAIISSLSESAKRIATIIKSFD